MAKIKNLVIEYNDYYNEWTDAYKMDIVASVVIDAKSVTVTFTDGYARVYKNSEYLEVSVVEGGLLFD